MLSHPATEPTPTETISTRTGPVELQGFVLPHKDLLSEEEKDRGGGFKGWAAQQGFYVYRSHRLLVAGGWLGLGWPRPWTMEESRQLARLRVEFENEGDSSWGIDIKKSAACPPRTLRPRMTDLARQVRDSAQRVFLSRGSYGSRTPIPEVITAWDSQGTGSGYRINRNHPVVLTALESAGEFRAQIEAALRVIEATVPIERIWLDTEVGGEEMQAAPVGPPPSFLIEIGRGLVGHWIKKIGMNKEHALSRLRSTDPFQNYPQVVEQVAEELVEVRCSQ